MAELFGSEIKRKKEKELPSVVAPSSQDGSTVTTSVNAGAYYSLVVDLEGIVKNENDLIRRYREISQYPDCDTAINDIVNEAIVVEEDSEAVKIITDGVPVSDSIKKKIRDEFDGIKRMLNFSNLGDEIFKRWYVDGRLYYHAVVDESNPKQGIQELRFIDPRKIRKVREVQKQRDLKTGIETIKAVSEYYVFNERGLAAQSYTASVNQGSRIAPDSVINVNSGMMDGKNVMVVSYLHKAMANEAKFQVVQYQLP